MRYNQTGQVLYDYGITKSRGITNLNSNRITHHCDDDLN